MFRYTNSLGYTLPDLKNTEIVSKRLCSLSRFFIKSTTTPAWATDNDLIEYSDTLPNLKKLKIISEGYAKADKNGRFRETSKITHKSLKKLTQLTTLDLHSQANITDYTLEKLTNLTDLRLYTNKNITNDSLIKLTNLSNLSLSAVNITDDGIKNLINLTHLDLKSFWEMTDDGLIDSSGEPKPRHPKLKLLLLPETSEHKITESAITLLEENGVTVKESEYSVADVLTTSSDSED